MLIICQTLGVLPRKTTRTTVANPTISTFTLSPEAKSPATMDASALKAHQTTDHDPGEAHGSAVSEGRDVCDDNRRIDVRPMTHATSSGISYGFERALEAGVGQHGTPRS